MSKLARHVMFPNSKTMLKQNIFPSCSYFLLELSSFIALINCNVPIKI